MSFGTAMMRSVQAASAVGAVLVVILGIAGFFTIRGPSRVQAKLQLGGEEVLPRKFFVRDPQAFRASPRLVQLAPRFQALYSASLGADPQSFLQKAPEKGKAGMFR